MREINFKKSPKITDFESNAHLGHFFMAQTNIRLVTSLKDIPS
jgi:hypothetical protein